MQQAAAAASLALSASESDADPAGCPTLVVFVVGGLGASEAASVGQTVQAAWALAAAEAAMETEAAAHGISADALGDAASGGRAVRRRPVPRVLLGGSCLSSPAVLLSQMFS